MSRYSLAHLGSQTLLRDVHHHLAEERKSVALVLAYLAEIDERRLYLPAAYDSMHAWCIGELHLSEDAASDRIRAARVARQFPAIFAMVADGRLHLAAVRLLAPYLTPESADELLAAAAHKSRAAVISLLAARFPRPDVLSLVTESPLEGQAAPAGEVGAAPVLSVSKRIEAAAPPTTEPAPTRSRVSPLSADSVAVQFTMARATHEKFQRVRELLGHELPAADIADVFDRALDALLGKLEQRKFAATNRPRRQAQRTSANPRFIPAHVMRAVWKRDGGQCTFMSDDGRRCAARHRIEFDHAREVARGGEATVDNLRLRCRRADIRRGFHARET